jgi:hypothetical protein
VLPRTTNRAVPDDARRDARGASRREGAGLDLSRRQFRPTPAPIDKAVASALGAIDPERIPAKLDYLERRLQLIVRVDRRRTEA